MGFEIIREGRVEGDPKTLVVGAGGDILIRETLAGLDREKGPDYLFSNLKQRFRGVDLLIANLETPLLEGGEKNPNKNPSYPFFKNPPSLAKTLRSGGFNVLCLANNHILDYGLEGLQKTRAVLTENGIQTFGAGSNSEEARTPLTFRIKGQSISFLAYSIAYGASETKAGCAPIKEEIIKEDISRVRQFSDIVVVSLHHGIIYSDYPVPESQKMTRRLALAGADIIIGHHPHVFQGKEIFQGSVIAHSLGSLINDTRMAEEKEKLKSCQLSVKGGVEFPENDLRTREGVFLLFGIKGEKSLTMEVLPILQPFGQIPLIAKENRGEEILTRYRNLSRELPDGHYPMRGLLQRLSGLEYLSDFRRESPKQWILKIFRFRLRHARLLWGAITYWGRKVLGEK